MDNPFGVGDVNGPGQRLDERGRFGRRPGPAVQPGGEASAFEPFHGEERPPFVRTDLVELDDVGVLHARRQLRLEPETKLLGEIGRAHV